MQIKKAKCQSGLIGYQCKLQDSYESYTVWDGCANTWGLHLKLGFDSARGAWNANPTIQGSVEPSDFCKIVDGERYFYENGKLAEDYDEN
jgi:hypothetical protein